MWCRDFGCPAFGKEWTQKIHKYYKISIMNLELLVGVIGFEPTAPCSQSTKGFIGSFVQSLPTV